MIRIAQFGQGNFLRAFADYYFDTLNEKGEYSVSIIKPGEGGNLDKFIKQNNIYHVVLRGIENGKKVEKVRKITVVVECVPYFDCVSFARIATYPDLRIVISNTTEAGIYFSEQDNMENLKNSSYPAKLTSFLYKRFSAGLCGVYILPTELIDNNADTLKNCVDKYIKLWKLPVEFSEWNERENYYCNTLVDRIVSGFPGGEEEYFYNLIGEKDELLTVGEPFGLWVIENKGNISDLIKEGKHGTEVVISNDIDYYKKRKVRVLNGSHTNMVFTALWEGAKTVYGAVSSPKIRDFVTQTLNEIVPFVSGDAQEAKRYAKEVMERFENPFINHQLVSISLNSVSKWKARVLPTFSDYYQMHKQAPEKLTTGLSYLVHTYRSLYKNGDAYCYNVKGNTYELKDEKACLDFFIDGGTLSDFLSEKMWGVNLNKLDGLTKKVAENLKRLERGESLL